MNRQFTVEVPTDIAKDITTCSIEELQHMVAVALKHTEECANRGMGTTLDLLAALGTLLLFEIISETRGDKS